MAEFRALEQSLALHEGELAAVFGHAGKQTNAQARPFRSESKK
jgi:hypothetical protein